uniref:Uncharacterized protein n=1 Tax=Meloidogyne incognita TaxID=6306 RepID=A0A914NXY5_MELIC
MPIHTIRSIIIFNLENSSYNSVREFMRQNSKKFVAYPSVSSPDVYGVLDSLK